MQNVEKQALNDIFYLWHGSDTIIRKIVMEGMKKSELTFYRVLIGVIYVVLAVLVIVAFIL